MSSQPPMYLEKGGSFAVARAGPPRLLLDLDDDGLLALTPVVGVVGALPVGRRVAVGVVRGLALFLVAPFVPGQLPDVVLVQILCFFLKLVHFFFFNLDMKKFVQSQHNH